MSNVTRMPNISPQNWPQQNWSGSWPPSCSCGCNPCQCGGGWGGMGGLMQCWQDIAQFQQFLMAMLSQMGPYPVQGVTDGSVAKPGNIGEFLVASATTAWSIATTTSVNQTVSVLVVPPGDWNVQVQVDVNFTFSGGFFNLSPVPAGLVGPLSGSIFGGGAAGQSNISMNSNVAQLTVSVPTLLPVYISLLNETAGTVTGNTDTWATARRMR